jgi:hypothetical protein
MIEIPANYGPGTVASSTIVTAVIRLTADLFELIASKTFYFYAARNEEF